MDISEKTDGICKFRLMDRTRKINRRRGLSMSVKSLRWRHKYIIVPTKY